jgi:small subunit ribosomal protein S1
VDGLLHITDISWGRVKHPSELSSVGDEIQVKVLNLDLEKERVSLGMKQLVPGSLEHGRQKYPVGSRVNGPRCQPDRLRRLRGTGGRHRRPDPRFRDVLDPQGPPPLQGGFGGRRGRRGGARYQARQPPHLSGHEAGRAQPVGCDQREIPDRHHHRGQDQEHHRLRLFIGIDEGIDGLVHISDISWTKRIKHPSEIYKKGDLVQAIVLDIDKENERFSLGIKQLGRSLEDRGRSAMRSARRLPER